MSAHEYVRSLFRERTGADLTEEKDYLIDVRLDPLLKARGLDSLDELVNRLGAGDPMLTEDRVVEALLDSETWFFRDFHPFMALKNLIIPELANKRSAEKRLTIWSCGCSTGQETYSLALVLRQYFPELVRWDISIMGSDISDELIETAQRGTYHQAEIGRGLPSALLVEYFDQKGLEWHIQDRIKQQIEFRAVNLNKAWIGLPGFDLVLLRNVLIDFAPEEKVRVLERIRQQMNPGGILLLGAAETLLETEVDLTLRQYQDVLFYERVEESEE